MAVSYHTICTLSIVPRYMSWSPTTYPPPLHRLVCATIEALFCMAKTLAYFGLECLPMVLYYAVSFHTDFRTSTALYVLATLIVVVIMFVFQKRLPYLSIIFGFFVVASGIATVFSDNPDLIIFSDTLYFLLGAFLLGLSLRSRRTLLETLFSPSFAITTNGWRTLTWLWVTVFLVAGITNELVRIFMTPEWWIGFQFWRGCAIAGLSVLFLFVSRHHRLPIASPWGIRLPEKPVGQ